MMAEATGTTGATEVGGKSGGGGLLELRPGDTEVCEGVYLLRGRLTEEEVAAVLAAMGEEKWHSMFLGEKRLFRLKAPYYGRNERSAEGHDIIPYYGFPGNAAEEGKDHPPYADMREAPAAVRAVWEKIAPAANQLLITKYATAAHRISAHSDKMETLSPEAPIVDLIVGPGASRLFVFSEPDGKEFPVTPSSGDIIVMSAAANRRGRHAVPAATRGLNKRTVAERLDRDFRVAEGGHDPATVRYSLVFREVVGKYNVQARRRV